MTKYIQFNIVMLRNLYFRREDEHLFITRETDYALRIFRELKDFKLHSTAVLSEEQKIPQAFSYKIIKKLSKKGWVEILRGVAGGCRMIADPADITLYDLMACMDEQTNLISCSQPGYVCNYREEHGNCVTHNNLCEIQNNLANELKSHTLKEILTGK